MNSVTQYQRDKLLLEARQLLRQRGELTADGFLRRPIRTAADARRRLAEIGTEQSDDRRRRLARLIAEVAPPAATGSVGLRRDPQGRLRLVSWDVGQVVVRPAREVTP
jgi:hypothetical protein